jgi:hypothetical protein
VDVYFLDPFLGTQVSRMLRNRTAQKMLLIKSDIILDTIKPYLKALQGIEPLDVPFSKYLHPGASLQDAKVATPEYSRVPGFRWHIGHLVNEEMVEASKSFDPNDEFEVSAARALLARTSVLDASQSNAIVDMLTQEVALVQGYASPLMIHVAERH